MFIELHILQNFAPSCLNRDDTNSPKDCEFGGYRRARISSQCLKRAIRTHFKEAGLLPEKNLAERTKRLVELIATRLAEQGRDLETAKQAVTSALAAATLKATSEGGGEVKTQYLLFLGNQEINDLQSVVTTHWDALTKPAETVEPGGKKKTAKELKSAAKNAAPAEVVKAVNKLLDGGKAADLALFGRMLADLPEKNVNAACQVAHAISTNKVTMEMDFYTAVDDLKPNDNSGADMLGTVEFNSACFYRYANIDCDGLLKNLHGDETLARETIKAFLQASREAIPTGKQNSSAAQNETSLVLAVVRERGLQSLANAFVQPVRPSRDQGVDKSLIRNSVEALDQFWGSITKAYGEEGVKAKSLVICLREEPELKSLATSRTDAFSSLVTTVLDSVSFTKNGKEAS